MLYISPVEASITRLSIFPLKLMAGLVVVSQLELRKLRPRRRLRLQTRSIYERQEMLVRGCQTFLRGQGYQLSFRIDTYALSDDSMDGKRGRESYRALPCKLC
jgi:hypothetical protein